MVVCGYIYFKYIHPYESNLEQYPPPPALYTSETCYEMVTTRFSLLAGLLLSLQALALSTSTVLIFFSYSHCKSYWRCMIRSMCARAFFSWLAKFMICRKKTPAKDIFCNSEKPSLFTGDVSQDSQYSFSTMSLRTS